MTRCVVLGKEEGDDMGRVIVDVVVGIRGEFVEDEFSIEEPAMVEVPTGEVGMFRGELAETFVFKRVFKKSKIKTSSKEFSKNQKSKRLLQKNQRVSLCLSKEFSKNRKSK